MNFSDIELFWSSNYDYNTNIHKKLFWILYQRKDHKSKEDNITTIFSICNTQSTLTLKKKLLCRFGDRCQWNLTRCIDGVWTARMLSGHHVYCLDSIYAGQRPCVLARQSLVLSTRWSGTYSVMTASRQNLMKHHQNLISG